MIGLNHANALFLYLVIYLAIVLVLWVRLLLRRQRRHWSLNDRRLFNCDNCHYAFLPKESGNISRCPRCNAICIRRRRGSFKYF